ncbi:uncharacterized protein Z518_06223 [Rhinocladiella mackenziei CBS 650.93]|uniref:Rhinocladiella mackenziei CBS 650.93 unplaced genomic scaffold supercont1.4, whole genome shotgun sequence n=1 Tax=Rhinocladiella mackenziei CBS 650.93 TaxID=1442369 RepID=A0A0D2IQ84_9EURO|nr:uncharacterized protein Z518_06223 [Rhinocladiella mackenziei CBS 650.93]KIX05351.1 hypothetical protein Z518_06223 [Rhinocladiella mackenziei CBS 650.93]
MFNYWYKGTLAQIFRKVAQQALSPKTLVYEDIMKLDGELREKNASIPPILKWKSVSSSIMDETHTILHRLNIELLYQKSLMILHRNYLSHDRSNPAFKYSREACIGAGLQVLQYQEEVHKATQPGGQLHNGNWISSSLSFHDFLLAAMVTCLDLYESHRQYAVTGLSNLESKAQRRKYGALVGAYDIWTSRKAISRDVKRASGILANILSKIPRPSIQSLENGAPRDLSSSAQIPAQSGYDVASLSAGSGGALLDHLSEEQLDTLHASKDFSTAMDFDTGGPLDAIFSGSDIG